MSLVIGEHQTCPFLFQSFFSSWLSLVKRLSQLKIGDEQPGAEREGVRQSHTHEGDT